MNATWAGNGYMRIGYAEREITPDPGNALAGFAMRANAPSSGVADPIKLKIVIFEDQVGTRACIASVDLLNWPRELVQHHRDLLSEALGVVPAAVLLTATHNHSGPQPNRSCATSLGAPTPGFTEVFERALQDVAARAHRRMALATAERAVTDHFLGEQRRLAQSGHRGPDPVDVRLTTIVFRGSQGHPLLALLHYACHPVVSAEQQLSADFPGFACTRLEQKLGAPAVFLQGFAGDINPGKSTTQGVDEARRVGRELADAAFHSLHGRKRVALDRVNCAMRHVDMPVIYDLETLSTSPELTAEWKRALVQQGYWESTSLTATCVRLSADLGFIGVNGELSSAYALGLREEHQDDVLAIGYTGGMFGYVPTAAQISEGGYEPVESAYYYGRPGRVAPESEVVVERLIRGAIEEAKNA